MILVQVIGDVGERLERLKFLRKLWIGWLRNAYLIDIKDFAVGELIRMGLLILLNFLSRGRRDTCCRLAFQELRQNAFVRPLAEKREIGILVEALLFGRIRKNDPLDDAA